ncbi:hypothetical protein IQ269_11770 [Tychonema sp. LEGE 07199]|uniref:hypothetical protein n=1 Tax=unclassified Tychonema TaxID=2642144 RepID=UPI001882A4A6|nr:MULTISPECIES: hypothetical protein [unclassified Tychonema]MBE9121456.1 hypothetical protein [Tychonema sp. LEGE 07199]MBE9133721.1 hypothetical protein [Tychonema sp. LEGE 07196]
MNRAIFIKRRKKEEGRRKKEEGRSPTSSVISPTSSVLSPRAFRTTSSGRSQA